MSNWRKSKSSFANGNCTEVASWRKSSASVGAGECAEVGQDGAVIGVRDSMDPGGPVLAFSGETWTAFLTGLRSG